MYNFDKKKFPVIWEVLEFVKSRTLRNATPRMTKKEAVYTIAKELHKIWESGGVKPLDIKNIINRYDKIIKYSSR
jgi:hypothetical protein